jgi:toxin ParE1/3/4
LAGINSFFEHLAQFPSMGRLRGDIENNVLAIPLKEYVIYYHVVDNTVVILRVLHSSRDVYRHFNRVK